MITTQKALRAEFWRVYAGRLTRRGRTKQNDYDSDTRLTWCSFVEYMYRNGSISNELAQRATL